MVAITPIESAVVVSCILDFRGLPGMLNTEIRHQLIELLNPIAEQHNVDLEFHELFEGVEAFEEKTDSELIKIAEKLSGYKAESVAFATEAPFLKQLGMQTVILGPGNIDQAHQADEFIALDQLKPSVELIRQFITHYCLKK